jgi:hypothetical protein
MTLRVRARNAATDSENRIHSDEVARQYGFRGGLVPGVTVYGYLMEAVEEQLPTALEVRFFKPVFDSDEVLIQREGGEVTARRADDLCARLTLGPVSIHPVSIPEAPLPDRDARPPATAGVLQPGTILGTVRKQLEDSRPEHVLNLANQLLLENFKLGPWLHVSSEIVKEGQANNAEELIACGRIQDQFEKKGREFVVLDVTLSNRHQRLETIRHTAIYCLG